MRRSFYHPAGMLAAVLLVSLLPAQPAYAAAPSVWIQNSADRAFRTTTMPAGAPTAISLFAARNEVEAAQILVRSGVALSNVYVGAGALTEPGGAVIPAANVKVTRAYLHPNIQKISGDYQNPPDGSDDYYDALRDNTPISLAAGTTQPYHYSVRVPAGQKPAVYTGSAVVNSSGGNQVVNISVRVYPVTLPPTNQSTLKVTNWTTSAGWDYTGTEVSIPLQYGVAMYDARWWRIVTNMAANHARHRNNVAYADFQALLIPHTTIDDAGNYTFGWQSFDRFVQIYIDAGAMQYIYTPSLLEGFDAATGHVKMDMIKKVNGRVQRVKADANTPETNAYLDKIFPALKAHLDQKGWTDEFYMSANDEPSTSQQIAAGNWLYSKYRQYFPNARTNEALNHQAPGLEGNLTTFTPVINLYESNVDYYQNQRVSGKDLWLYNCIIPQGEFMNRFTSFHLAKTRLTFWLLWKVGGTGYLHWGWNYWLHFGETPRKIDAFNDRHSGDNWLVYPKPETDDVYDSLRSEAQLDGIEEYELLTQLAASKPLTAKAIAESLITNSVAYTRSGADVVDRHKQLLDALTSTGSDMAFPFSDSFANEQSWRHTRGTWSIATTGEYLQTDTSDWGFTSAVEGRSYADLAASVDLKIVGVNPNGGNANWAGFMLRSLNGTDMGSGYLVGLRNNGEVFVYRSGVTLKAAPAPGYVPGTYTRLRVSAVGNTIKVWVGNHPDPVLTVADPKNAYTAGSVALVTGGTSVRFDNMRINPMVNAAEGKPVTASSSYQADGWSTGAATDGRRSSVPGAMGWSSLSSPTVNHTESATVDLGASKPVSRIDLYPRNDGANTGAGFPIDFTVQVSNDNTNWATVASRTGHPRPGNAAQSFPFASTQARYVRVTGTNLRPDQFGNYHLQFAEIETAGGNLAAGRAVSSSSSVEAHSEGWLRANATDGARSNLWYSMGFSSALATTNHTEWLSVDLGGSSLVERVDLYPRNDGANTGAGFPVDFTIAVSNDNVNWTTVASRTGYPRPGVQAQTFTFARTTARYVRVTGTNLRTDPGGYYLLQLSELEVR